MGVVTEVIQYNWQSIENIYVTIYFVLQGWAVDEKQSFRYG